MANKKQSLTALIREYRENKQFLEGSERALNNLSSKKVKLYAELGKRTIKGICFNDVLPYLQRFDEMENYIEERVWETTKRNGDLNWMISAKKGCDFCNSWPSYQMYTNLLNADKFQTALDFFKNKEGNLLSVLGEHPKKLIRHRSNLPKDIDSILEGTNFTKNYANFINPDSIEITYSIPIVYKSFDRTSNELVYKTSLDGNSQEIRLPCRIDGKKRTVVEVNGCEFYALFSVDKKKIFDNFLEETLRATKQNRDNLPKVIEINKIQKKFLDTFTKEDLFQ